VSGAVTILPVEAMPEVRSGDDVGAIIFDAAVAMDQPIQNGDVVVVTHKIVSKAEGRVIDLETIEPSAIAIQYASIGGRDPRHVEVVLRESARIVRMDRGLIIAETRHGFICANAGVDASNVPGENTVCLLPLDPDASAEQIRLGLKSRGADTAVVISDSFGRPWRNGITNIAIGLAGLSPFADYREQYDPYGYLLKASVIAVADELAAAAELVMGKILSVPVAVVRGYSWTPAAGTARQLVMDPTRDLFR
jgi:coenzyme F420-0:L-glutamate ligase / coenzyme F420-1:gamma-L-glutamate ligase